MLEIIRGLEKPKRARRGRAPQRKYPFETMAVGEAFFVPGKRVETMRSYAGAVGRAIGRKFSVTGITMRKTSKGWQPCKSDDPGATAGAGVWREK